VSVLDRKLTRDLGRLVGQVLTIAVVVGCGIAAYVTLQGTLNSLLDSRDAYYERYRFGDVFAHCRRAPNAIAERLLHVEGVARVYPRLSELVSVPLDEEPDPLRGRILSLPDDLGPQPMNALFISRGRRPEPGRGEEILLLETFAESWDLGPGDTLPVVLNGTLRRLRIVGTALSPEYIMAVEPGAFIPDPNRFAVLWMARSALAPSFDMAGAFDDVTLQLQPGADLEAVLDDVDRVLEPYGSTGAIGRSRQESHYILNGELEQLETMARVVPTIFLAVAAFLLNIVLGRLIRLQRVQIAALKALGYADRTIGLHYLKLVTVIVILGAIAGAVAGFYLGRGFTGLYAEYFHFPVLIYRLDVRTAAIGVGASLLAAVVGALGTVRQILRMQPAEAMRPPAPARYRAGLVEQLGLLRPLGQSARMIAREILRRPLRTLLSSVGIAMAVAIMVAGSFGTDAFEHLIDRVFQRAMTEDLAVAFAEPMPERSVRELAHLPGVTVAEGLRVSPVRFRAGPVERDGLLQGMEPDLTLRRLFDARDVRVPIPAEGLLITRKLGEILRAGVGDEIELDVLEGQRETHRLPVAGLIDESYGLNAYLRLDAANRLLREDRRVSLALLRVDPTALDDVRSRLRDRPSVLAVNRREATIESFRKTTGQTWGVMIVILSLFSGAIAVGVVYNNARVSLSMRSRDLASLRVLGFTRGEISAVLLGELAVQVLLAIPIGLLIGTWMADGVMATVDQERYRMQAIILPRTYAYATLVTLVAGAASALLVRRKLDHLDLIGVLKTRE
jgi:putative ABC transport system permease protein